MENSKTPYGCGICKKMFHKPMLLLRHIELRHPQSARKFSLLSNENSGTAKTNSRSANQRSLSQEISNGGADSLVSKVGTNIDKTFTLTYIPSPKIDEFQLSSKLKKCINVWRVNLGQGLYLATSLH